MSSLLEEKKQLACQLQEQQRRIEELTALVSSKAALLGLTAVDGGSVCKVSSSILTCSLIINDLEMKP